VSNNVQAIDQYVADHLDASLEEVKRICAQPSVSARHEGIDDCAALVARILQAHGFNTQIFQTPGHPVVVGTMSGKADRTLLFYNHYDVQPPEPLELWTSPPFQPEIRDGALYARGAKDDKGEFIARLAAVDAVRAAHGGQLPCNVTFVVEGEEEIGSQHFAEFALAHINLLEAQGAIWEEGGIDARGEPACWLGPRGLLYVELAVTTMRRDAHSGSAHVLPNAAWRLLRALSTLKGDDERVLIPGFYDDALPLSDRERALIKDFYDDGAAEASSRATFGVERFVNGLTGLAWTEAVYQPTCNIAGLTAGYQGPGSKTVIPAHASAKVDFRLVPNQDPRDILAKLRAHLDQQGFTDVTVTQLGGMGYPYKQDPDNPLIQLSLRAAKEVYGTSGRVVPLIGGTTPVYAIARPLGNIPVISPGVGYWDNKTHAPDEHVRVTDFQNAARHIGRILDGFADL
jgi:acetylornithine deacetylase/succinyl-diaminopimelate desuccinylase-like protein